MILKNARVISPKDKIDGIFDIEISGEKIANIEKSILKKDETIDLTGKIVVPAFVEMHCHLREPGFEEKETIESGVESAIQGGYAAICPMANTNPVNDSLETLDYQLKQAVPIKIYPICALTKSLKGKELNDMIALGKAGAVAFSDDGMPVENMSLLFEAMQIAKERGLLTISHAEDASIHDKESFSEDVAVARELELLRNVNCRYHFAHISTKRSVELIRRAKKEGLNVTCETAPHYFSLSKSDIINGEARFKMNPPLRTQADIEAIKEGLKDATIDVIATDHAPHTLEQKLLPWSEAPMGIVGFETALGLSMTNLVKTGVLTLGELIEKLSVNPSNILKIPFGNIRQNEPANLAVIDENCIWKVEASRFKSKCKISPFEGKKLTGKVIKTIIKGKIYDNV